MKNEKRKTKKQKLNDKKNKEKHVSKNIKDSKKRKEAKEKKVGGWWIDGSNHFPFRHTLMK